MDTNNYIRHNTIETKDQRFEFYKPYQHFEFIDVLQSSPWEISNYSTHICNATYDGKTYGLQEFRLMYGSYYFLSEERVVHQRIAYNILDLLSEVGGLVSSVFRTLKIIGTFIN